MALTISQAGSNNSTTSTATLVVTLTQSVSVGDMLVVCIAADNQGSAGAASISSVTDSKSHTYTSRASQNNDPGAANAGATVAIFVAPITTAMTTSDTVTINFSPNTTSKAAVIWEVVAGATEFPKYLSNGGTTGSTANPSLASTSISSGDAVIYALAAESNATLTGDSDTTNGSWSTLYTTAGNTGTSATSMTVGSQYKVTTGTGTQTWNTTLTSSDWGISYIVVDPAARIDRTATGSGTGTDSASRVITRLRTATGSGTGTESVTGVRVKVRTATGSGTGTSTASGEHIHARTATGSGTGSATVISLITRSRTATGSGTGTGSGDCDFIHSRTATGSGTGTSSSTELVTPGTTGTTYTRTATGSGVGSGEADVDLVHLRTATGSGTGTSTSVGRHIHDRIATGSGTGSATVSGQYIRSRTSTGSGTGTSSATGVRIPSRTATGTGTGTSSATFYRTPIRTATGTGTGTSSTVCVITHPRTATGSGTGTQVCVGARLKESAATGAGTGDAFADWMKSHILRLPATDEYPGGLFAHEGQNHRLRSYDRSGRRARNLYKLTDGTYTTVEQRDQGQVEKVYLGSHQIFLTDDEVTDLTTAGYGSYIS